MHVIKEQVGVRASCSGILQVDWTLGIEHSTFRLRVNRKKLHQGCPALMQMLPDTLLNIA